MNSESFGVKFASIVAEYNASRDCIDKGAICHAPETSLYFGRDGKISACCYSREAPLGSYPEQTISEIWNGTQANSMRAAMRRNELPKGCELCAEKLLAHNFTQLVAKSYDVSARPLPPEVSP